LPLGRIGVLAYGVRHLVWLDEAASASPAMVDPHGLGRLVVQRIRAPRAEAPGRVVAPMTAVSGCRRVVGALRLKVAVVTVAVVMVQGRPQKSRRWFGRDQKEISRFRRTHYPHRPSSQAPEQQSLSKKQLSPEPWQPHCPSPHEPEQQSLPKKQSAPSGRQPQCPSAQTPEQHSSGKKHSCPSGLHESDELLAATEVALAVPRTPLDDEARALDGPMPVVLVPVELGPEPCDTEVELIELRPPPAPPVLPKRSSASAVQPATKTLQAKPAEAILGFFMGSPLVS